MKKVPVWKVGKILLIRKCDGFGKFQFMKQFVTMESNWTLFNWDIS